VQHWRDLVKENAKLYREALSFPYFKEKRKPYKERPHFNETRVPTLSTEEDK
jgi:hypothetical protein